MRLWPSLFCDVAQLRSWLPTLQDSLPIPSSVVKQSLEIKPVGFPETSLTNHQPTPFNVPEGHSSRYAAAET